MTIEWNGNLKTGISIIDEQHRLLFETINKLGLVKESRSKFNEILMELQTYISLHFKTEEEYMRYTEYPDYCDHKNIHDEFASDYKKILKKNATAEKVLELQKDLVDFLEGWIEEHYRKEDVKLAEFIKKCGIKN